MSNLTEARPVVSPPKIADLGCDMLIHAGTVTSSGSTYRYVEAVELQDPDSMGNYMSRFTNAWEVGSGQLLTNGFMYQDSTASFSLRPKTSSITNELFPPSLEKGSSLILQQLNRKGDDTYLMGGVGVFWIAGTAPLALPDDYMTGFLTKSLKNAYLNSTIRANGTEKNLSIKVEIPKCTQLSPSFVWAQTTWPM